ncbi:unnamed protein product, partial [Heterosigma akashiwo]
AEGCTKAGPNGAASFGHVEIVEWFHRVRGAACSASGATEAARHGHLRVL